MCYLQCFIQNLIHGSTLHAWEPKFWGGKLIRVYCRVYNSGGGKFGVGVGNPRAPHPLYETLTFLLIVSPVCR